MANANTPQGLKPVRYLNGNPYMGAVNVYNVLASDGTLIGIGDLVKLAGTASTINGMVYQDVVRAATGDVFTGVVVGVQPVTLNSTIYREASTQRLLYVADDPNLLFEAQENSGGTAFTANDLGLNCNIIVAGASTTTGLSASELDTSTEATTNTLDLKLYGFVNRADNAVGANAKWLVRINRHTFANQVAGI